jgi:hypothetical protein
MMGAIIPPGSYRVAALARKRPQSAPESRLRYVANRPYPAQKRVVRLPERGSALRLVRFVGRISTVSTYHRKER